MVFHYHRKIMYNSSGLIPARFLILISHFIICVILLWNKEENMKGCSMALEKKMNTDNHPTQLVTGLSLMLSFLCFEMLAFVFGLTMFNTDSALLSIGGHSLACICLTGLVLNDWHCGWFWWIFSFGAALPFIHDTYIAFDDTQVAQPGWSKLLILAGVSTTLGLSLPVGYHIGVVNTPAKIMKVFCNESIQTKYDLFINNSQLDLVWSSIVSIFLVGAAVGSLCGSSLADRYGRKGVLIVSSVLGILAAIFFIASKPANSIEMLFLGRLLVGLSAGLTTAVVPMYLTELAPLHLRGAMGVLCPLGVTIGVLLGQIISIHNILGNEEYWCYCLAAHVLPLLFSTLTLPILPESPKYLYVIKKLPREALKQLKKLRNMEEEFLSAEINELKIEQQDNEESVGESWGIKTVLSKKSLSLPLLLVCSLQLGQQFSGINSVFYYSNEIFLEAGLSTSAGELATIGTGCCNVFMAILSLWVMSKFNRRIVLQLSMVSSIFFLILLGVAIMFIKSYSWVPYLSIIGVLGFVTCYGLGLGPIPYFVGSELFEVGPRPSAMSLGSMSNWGGNLIIGLTFPTMKSCIGPASFFVFAAIVLMLLIFIRIYLPETRGRDVTEIAALCQYGFSSKPSEVREMTRLKHEEICGNHII